jgi:hypothetical protein
MLGAYGWLGGSLLGVQESSGHEATDAAVKTFCLIVSLSAPAIAVLLGAYLWTKREGRKDAFVVLASVPFFVLGAAGGWAIESRRPLPNAPATSLVRTASSANTTASGRP